MGADVRPASPAPATNSIGAKYARIRELAVIADSDGYMDSLKNLDEAMPPAVVVELVDTLQGLAGRVAETELRARSLGASLEAAEARLEALQDESDRRVAAAREEASAAHEVVRFLLDLAERDAAFAEYAAPGTEVFLLLCQAEAARRGEPIDVVMMRRARAQEVARD